MSTDHELARFASKWWEVTKVLNAHVVVYQCIDCKELLSTAAEIDFFGQKAGLLTKG